MTDRREFLQAGLAASLAAGAAVQAARAEGLWPACGPALALHSVLVDAAVPESARFGQLAAAHGVPVHAVADGDFTEYWYQQLDPLWRRAAAPIAGLTRHGPLFVLERMAWDRGMRVVFRGEHVAPAASGPWAHRLSGPARTLEQAGARVGAGPDWVADLAAVVLRSSAAGLQSSLVLNAEAPGHTARDALYSWVIA